VKGLGGNGVLSDILAIAAGGQTSLALRADGTVWSWGVNNKGQLGNNVATKYSAPPLQVKAQLGDLSGMKAIAGGSAHCLALKADGTVWAWGWNSNGQLGDGSTSDRSTAAAVKGGKKLGTFLKNVKAIAAGGTATILQPSGGHTLALVAQGEVFGWGWNVKGRARQCRADFDGTRPQSRWSAVIRAIADGCGDCCRRPAQSGDWSRQSTEVSL